MLAKCLFFLWLSLVLNVPVARACGGFFCTTVPMNQVAENILFIQGEGTVTTHVQIQYSGTAADFAWVLPLPAVPELAVSHNQIFAQLQGATQPDFQLNFVDEGGCYDNHFYDFIFPESCSTCAGVGVSGPPSVEVVAQEQIGPYHTAVISSDDAQAIVDWLVDNGYQLGELGVELLTPYVEEGFYFLALKLAPDRDVGDLQPIAVTYAADAPGIPIRLTAVATEPDLGILTYILGEHRAIPQNYLHVQINEALIDWFDRGFNYPEVVTQAANEAGGQAFVTDYAGPSTIVRNFFFWEFDLAELRRQTHPADFLNATLWQGFPSDAQMQTLIRRHIPIPPAVLTEGVLEVVFAGDRKAYERAQEEGWLQDTAERSFYNNMRTYDRYLADFAFDANAFADDLQRIVVEPLEGIRQFLEEKPYLTRLYTTLSADEMTLDPMFAYNPDLPDVSQVRSADLRTDCADDLGDTRPEEEWEVVITLSDGRKFRSRPFTDLIDPLPLPLVGEPAAAVVERLTTSGPPQVLRAFPTTIAATAGSTPTSWSLLPNYPNPFNAGTILPFIAPDSAPAALRIYNLHGQKVRTFATDQAAAGYGEVVWDGRDHSGRVVASGVYLYRLETQGVELTRKLLFLR